MISLLWRWVSSTQDTGHFCSSIQPVLASAQREPGTIPGAPGTSANSTDEASQGARVLPEEIDGGGTVNSVL